MSALAAALRALLRHPGNEAVRRRAEATLADYDIGQSRLAKHRKVCKQQVTPVVIGNQRFASLHGAYMYAKTQGFDGSEGTFQARHRRELPWDDLIKPVAQTRSDATTRGIARKRQEMKDVIAAMDARRKP